ncbi:MAG: acyl-CoA thioesterase [Candidatus Heimdallarchaeota archaeon]|nr:acyl-CoA thioesterase [Candidatus Heimdallarchaeota archaeon]MDH5646269.1 acyl-CoA thioesterase [Candidatus Heimdallarchaeota archaeon]
MDSHSKFISEQIVRFSDTDAAGIVYFGAFATYFDESFIAALKSKSIDWLSHRKYGFLLPIVEQNIKFYHPLRAGDRVFVEMEISLLKKRSFTSNHKMYIDENQQKILVAEGKISRVVVSYNEFKAIEIPEVLREVLSYFNVEN